MCKVVLGRKLRLPAEKGRENKQHTVRLYVTFADKTYLRMKFFKIDFLMDYHKEFDGKFDGSNHS